jgi:hypothetical protein
MSGSKWRGLNNEPLTAGELAHWARLEADPFRRARRDRMHQAHMWPGLAICAICWGWVDDPRHDSVGYPARRL